MNIEKQTNVTLISDSPISRIEDDKLDRLEFAEHIASSLLKFNYASCLTISLNGPWGIGKSSLINLIEAQLRSGIGENTKYVVLKFNPWNFKTQDQLIGMFFRDLKIAVSRKKPINYKLLSNLLDYTSIFLSLAAGVSPIGGNYISIGASSLKEISGRIQKASDKTLENIKSELDAALSNQFQRIFIFIDDIDRLDQEAAILMFRLIRLNADFSNVTYILSFDNEIIHTLLDKEHPNHGKEYLEKIVQIPINVPSLDKSLLTKTLESSIVNFALGYGHDPSNDDGFRDLISRGHFFDFFTNMRDIVRYTNCVQMTFPLVQRDVNFYDFLGLEAIRVFSPKSYEYIRYEKELLTARHLRRDPNDLDFQKSYKDTLTAIYRASCSGAFNAEIISPDLNSTQSRVESMINFLFPQISKVEARLRVDYNDAWRREKRLCDFEIFDRYFILNVSGGDISEDDMQSLKTIIERENPDEICSAIVAKLYRGLGQRLFSLLSDYREKIRPAALPYLIASIFKAENEIYYEINSSPSMGLSLSLENLFYSLLEKCPKDERGTFLTRAMELSQKVSLPIFMIFNLIQMIKNEEREEEKLLSDSDLDNLKNFCVGYIERNFKNPDFSKLPQLYIILIVWHDWAKKGQIDELNGKIRDWITNLITTGDGFLDLLVGFSSRVIVNGQEIRFRVLKKRLSEFSDINNLKEKAQQIKLSNTYQQLTNMQKQCIESMMNGKGDIEI